MTEIVVERNYHYYPGRFVSRLINVLVGIVEALLALRLVLELLGASASSQFVSTIYGITQTFIGPFAGAFPNYSLGGGSVLDIAAILAMIGYAILGWILIQLLSFIFTSL